MNKRLTDAIFSLNGVSLLLGVLGFLSGIVQLFVDVSAQLSIKWLLLSLLLAISVALILLKIIYDLHNEKRPAPPFEVPIRYLPNGGIFIIRRNENFLNNIIVGCYLVQDELDTLACLGVVHIVQEKFIQIKIYGKFLATYTPSDSSDSLSRFIIRPVVPYDAVAENFIVSA